MQRRIIVIAILVVMIITENAALSAPATASPKTHSLDNGVEIDGLLLDQTKTRSGHDFFCRFSSCWENPDGTDSYNIVIMENASPQWGSMVGIKVNDMVVFQSLLKPRDADIRDTAAKAIERVQDYVRTSIKDGRKLNEDDLALNGW